jgi:replicative DNA helicase
LDLLDRARGTLTPLHFASTYLRALYSALCQYRTVAGGVLPRDVFTVVLAQNSVDRGTVLGYAQTFDALAATVVPDDQFTWALSHLRDLHADARTGDTLTTAAEILRQGIPDPSNPQAPPQRGHAAARSYLLSALADIDRDYARQSAPAGDVRAEAQAILAEYASRAALNNATTRAPRPTFGIPPIDRRIGGLSPGELVVVLGASGEGKSTVAVQAAHTAILDSLDVVYVTSETSREVTRRRILARHSTLPAFQIPEGFDSARLRDGTLPPEHRQKLGQVVADLTSNPAYGHLYLAQSPRSASLETVEALVYAELRNQHVDLLVIDYLALLAPASRRQSSREELAQLVKSAKALAQTFDNGRGTVVLTPWQTNRSGAAAARAAESYDHAAAAETSEIVNSADLVLSLLATGERSSRKTQAYLQILKNRDGALGRFEVTIDYATSNVTEHVGAMSSTTEGPDLSGYLPPMLDILSN